MSFDVIWQPGTGLQWLQALAIPTLPWVKQFLVHMNFPSVLVENIKVFTTIHTEAIEKRAVLWDANKKLGYLPELDTAITREFVTEALKKLEAEVGSEATIAFKHWAYRNLVCGEFTNAFLGWRVILRRACDKNSSRYKLVMLPTCLSALLPQIADLLQYECDQEIEDKLRLLSPPSEQEADELGLDMSSEAQIVREIIRNEYTITALQYIGKALSESERSVVVAWAEAQATEQQIPVKLLLGDMLLKSVVNYKDYDQPKL